MSYFKGCEIKIASPVLTPGRKAEVMNALNAKLPGAEFEWTEDQGFRRLQARAATVPDNHPMASMSETDTSGKTTQTGARTLLGMTQDVLDELQR